ncbi:MAG: hypothetical protein OXG65_00670 [Chloroflexi bacterium]|nr:hypothetical protein [Chloroflexota bacterium]
MSRNQRFTEQIWLNHIDAERSAQYYRLTSDRYRRRHSLMVSGVGVATIAAGALNTAGHLSSQGWVYWLGLVFSFGAGAGVLMLIRLNDARTVAKAESAYAYFAMLGRDWQRAWDSPVDDETTLSILTERMANSPEVGVAIDDQLNERCHIEAVQTVGRGYDAQYAAA